MKALAGFFAGTVFTAITWLVLCVMPLTAELERTKKERDAAWEMYCILADEKKVLEP